MSPQTLAKQEQLSSDITVLLQRIKEIHEEELLHRYDLRNNLTDRRRYEEERARLLKTKRERKARFEDLIANSEEDVGMRLSSPVLRNEPENTAFAKEINELSEALTEVGEKLVENENGLKQIKNRIVEVMQDLEDTNTKRLSLRIQLSQLMKERSLLLFNTHLKWCVLR